MWLILFFSLIRADSCDHSLNDAVDWVNPDCNYAGICYNGACYCCDTTLSSDWCQGNVPGVWEGDNCEKATYYTQVTWGYIFEGSDLTCANDGTSAASPDLVDQTVALFEDFDAEVMSMECKICTPAEPCEFFTEGPVADSGTFVKFGVDLNTFYDMGCSKGTLPESIRPCAANWDNGATAYVSFIDAMDKDNDYAQFLADLQALVSSNGENGLSWSSTTLSRIWNQHVEILSQTIQTTRLPTPSPTPEPSTQAPTNIPTSIPTDFSEDDDGVCDDYINSIGDLKFLGVGSSCRGSINESWTGGRTCESPYIICLPKENTPANDMMGDPYKSKTYRYNVAECLQECSYDQRCLGIEFVADKNSVLGDCNLIDDIPITTVDEIFGYVYTEADLSLDNDTTGGDALCWAKKDYCNPYFEAEDLSDVMLNCYCPDNRKGFYTKKVKRTVNNTRFCDDDATVDERIKKAQANRMFHLCENWCLFETINPQSENWYWDPWKVCWRETYSGAGMHRSYCDRVIRNPDSIELNFINYRSENFLSCGASEYPTSAPISDAASWHLAAYAESCDDACSNLGKVCAEEITAQAFGSESEMINAFAEAGHTCDSDTVQMENAKFEGYALPGLKRSNSACVNRQPTLSHLENLDTDCSKGMGYAWQRLCACY